MAEAFAKAEMLDVKRAIESQALAVRPGEVLPLGDRRIGVAIVLLQFHGRSFFTVLHRFIRGP